MEIKEILNIIGKKSKNSQKEVAFASHDIRQKVLKLCAEKIKSNIEKIITRAVKKYSQDVKNKKFPLRRHSYF